MSRGDELDLPPVIFVELEDALRQLGAAFGSRLKERASTEVTRARRRAGIFGRRCPRSVQRTIASTIASRTSPWRAGMSFFSVASWVNPASSATRRLRVFRRLASNLHAPCTESVERKSRDGARSLRGIAAPCKPCGSPIGDLELRHLPSRSVQPVAADERVARPLEYEQLEFGALCPFHVCITHSFLCPSRDRESPPTTLATARGLPPIQRAL